MSKCIKIIASAVIMAFIVYGILIFWQLHAFDKFIKKHGHESFHIYAVECESLDDAIFSRNLKIITGFDQDKQLSSPFLKMEGKFIPGLFPSIELKAIPLDPKNEILVKAQVKLNLDFDYFNNPRKARLSWHRAQDKGEILGDGYINIDFDFDKDKRNFRSIDIKGNLDEAKFLWDGGSYYLGNNSLNYSYHDKPHKLNFMYKSTGDRIEADIFMPQINGPYFYNLTISNNKKENISEYEFNFKDFVVDVNSLPSLDIYLKGSLITPAEVWLPCVFSQFIASSEFLNFPGVCPFKSNADSIKDLSFENIKGKLSAFNLSWEGTDIKIKGDFGENKEFYSNFEIVVDFAKDLKAGDESDIAGQLNYELKNYIEALASEGAFKKIKDNSYKMDLKINMDDGNLKITGNGVDLLKTQPQLDFSDPMYNP